jgi:superfamily I DNA and/or RNA helicase
MADKITKCMQAAAYIARAECHLDEARRSLRKGDKSKVLLSLQLASDAARMAKHRNIVVRARDISKEINKGRTVIATIDHYLVDTKNRLIKDARVVFRQCGAKVDF